MLTKVLSTSNPLFSVILDYLNLFPDAKKCCTTFHTSWIEDEIGMRICQRHGRALSLVIVSSSSVKLVPTHDAVKVMTPADSVRIKTLAYCP
jgi:hypothetical protein